MTRVNSYRAFAGSACQILRWGCCLLWLFLTGLSAQAQIGEHRNDFAIGVNGGYILSNVSFLPKVPQTFHGGLTAGLSARYVCEKYFSAICSIYGEVNIAQIGWKERIWDRNDNPVVNEKTGMNEQYQRNMTYLQIPVFAHLAWGREQKGLQFFFQAGPQFGFHLGDKSEMNFELSERNIIARVSQSVVQDTMAVQNKIDYGITAGLGLEYSHPKMGHLLLEARYYYGLGNMYKDSKRDYFSTSRFSNIVVKLTYLFDITRTRRDKNK